MNLIYLISSNSFAEICYGFEVMLSNESPDVPFTVMLSRFQQGITLRKGYTSCKLSETTSQPKIFNVLNFESHRENHMENHSERISELFVKVLGAPKINYTLLIGHDKSYIDSFRNSLIAPLPED